jgi:hypothetical protein
LGAVDDLVNLSLGSTGPSGVKPIEVKERKHVHALETGGFLDVSVKLLCEEGGPFLLSVGDVGVVDVLPGTGGRCVSENWSFVVRVWNHLIDVGWKSGCGIDLWA